MTLNTYLLASFAFQFFWLILYHLPPASSLPFPHPLLTWFCSGSLSHHYLRQPVYLPATTLVGYSSSGRPLHLPAVLVD